MSEPFVTLLFVFGSDRSPRRGDLVHVCLRESLRENLRESLRECLRESLRAKAKKLNRRS